MLVVGSYATSPNLWALEHPGEVPGYEADREAAFYAGLAECALVDGLEVQVDGNGNMHGFNEPQFLSEFANPRFCAVLTCIGGTMGNVGADPAFGLASTDDAGRRKALDFAKQALACVSRWNTRSATAGRVLAVEIHSAPNTTKEGAASASVEAFVESLVEMLSWDWQGARLCVEHCDSAAVGTAAGFATSKGFLTIEDELAACALANERTRSGAVGVTINWARSVLEGRDVGAPNRHIAAARDAGLLCGVMMSGCTGESKASNAYGCWRDCHMPCATRSAIAEGVITGALLTPDAVASALSEARFASGGLLYSGCKITTLHSGRWVGQSHDDTPMRVALNCELLELVAAARGGASDPSTPPAATG